MRSTAGIVELTGSSSQWRRMTMNNIPRNTEASMYWDWFKKEYPELFKCDISETVESCEECGFCEVKAEKETLNEQGCRN